jgi:hypothetical protein
VSGEEGDLWFRYPLITLYLFRPLTWFSYETAWCIWLGLKLAALGGLLVVWRSTFLRDTDGLLMSFAVLLGFNGAMPWDICAGNKAIFEQLLLWLGFVALVRGYLWQFSATTVASSLFNVTPAAFLSLLLSVQERKRGITVMACAIVVLVLLVAVPYAGRPELLDSMIHSNMNSGLHGGTDNPTFMALLNDCAYFWPSSFIGLKHVPFMLWALYAAVIIGFSFRALMQAVKRGDTVGLLMLAVITYVVVMPRMMLYTYILPIPPALLAVHHLFQRFSHRLIAVAVLSFPVRLLFDPPFGEFPSVLSALSPWGLIGYYSWLLALVLWGLYVTGKVKLPEGKSDEDGIAAV